MCIKRSVGLSGRNDLMDVTIVQILLNLNLPRFTAPKPVALKTDGRIGRARSSCSRALKPKS